jgi:uncharacterized protein YbcI
MNQRRGELEARITEAMVAFEREFMGRGPTEARTYIVEDLVIVRMKGIITRAEHHLASGDPTGRGRDLVKQSRTELIEKAKPMLLALIEKETAIPVVSLHTDISVKAGERIIVFTLQRKLPDLA